MTDTILPERISHAPAVTAARIGEPRPVPGPRSKAIFQHEAEAMARC